MKRGKEPDLHGLIVVDKPALLTSHDVVSRIRRYTGIKRVGHAGTLDPFATGVVVVAVGRATRVLQHVQDTDKHYLAHVVLGAATDSADVDGTVVSRSVPDGWPSEGDVLAALQPMIGVVEQIPPIYSAIKVDGQPLYRQARAGKDVEAPTRQVSIYAMDLIDYNPPDVVLSIHCGKGTYVRSVARDLGAALGTYGYCHGLRRIATGPFSLEQAWSIDELFEIDPREHWHRVALHPDFALCQLQAVVLSERQTVAWYHGQSFDVDRHHPEDVKSVRVYSSGGYFAGVGTMAKPGTMKPRFVFHVPDKGEET